MIYRDKKIFVFRNYTIEPLFSKYKSIEYSNYDGFDGFSGKYDLFLWLYLCPVKNDPKLLVHEIDNIYNKLELSLTSLVERKTSMLIFTLENWVPFSFQNSNFEVVDAINNYNSKIRELEGKHDFIKIIDLSDFTSEFSKKDLIDWKFYYISQMMLNPKLAKPFQSWFTKKIDSIFSFRKKCLVLDLDNTLWGGVLGEDGIDGIEIGDVYPGSAYKDFQNLISVAAQNGVLLATCSKNNEHDVKEVWLKHPEMLLKEGDFVAHRINWNDKASNIAEIAKELNIGVDSLVFIDDNPIERELVKSMLPEVTVPDFPDQPYLLGAFFKQVYSENFQIYGLTKEDENKSQQYHQERDRKTAASKFDSIESYIKSLNIELKIHSANKFNVPRIAQMTQKTNQFNLRTKRYTEDNIWKFIDDGHMVNCISVTDNFGDNGITIASIFVLNHDSKCATVDSFLLSCRILGRKVEICSFQFLLNVLFDKGIRKIEAEYIKTAKNGVCSRFYDDVGFKIVNETNETKKYLFNLSEPIVLSEDYKFEFENGK